MRLKPTPLRGFQTNSREVEARRAARPRSMAHVFQTNSREVEAEIVHVVGERIADRFRRTLVRLKQTIMSEVHGSRSWFQTNSREVEAGWLRGTGVRHSAFQTNSREVEANTSNSSLKIF